MNHKTNEEAKSFKDKNNLQFNLKIVIIDSDQYSRGKSDRTEHREGQQSQNGSHWGTWEKKAVLFIETALVQKTQRRQTKIGDQIEGEAGTNDIWAWTKIKKPAWETQCILEIQSQMTVRIRIG